MSDALRLYLCFEPEFDTYARMIDGWAVSNADLATYGQRMGIAADSADAKAIQDELKRQIASADVTLCLVGQLTGESPWIDWELAESKRCGNALVGVTLNELNTPPAELADAGAVFVGFRRDLIERAVHWALTERHDTGDYTLRDF